MLVLATPTGAGLMVRTVPLRRRKASGQPPDRHSLTITTLIGLVDPADRYFWVVDFARHFPPLAHLTCRNELELFLIDSLLNRREISVVKSCHPGAIKRQPNTRWPMLLRWRSDVRPDNHGSAVTRLVQVQREINKHERADNLYMFKSHWDYYQCS